MYQGYPCICIKNVLGPSLARSPRSFTSFGTFGRGVRIVKSSKGSGSCWFASLDASFDSLYLVTALSQRVFWVDNRPTSCPVIDTSRCYCVAPSAYYCPACASPPNPHAREGGDSRSSKRLDIQDSPACHFFFGGGYIRCRIVYHNCSYSYHHSIQVSEVDWVKAGGLGDGWSSGVGDQGEDSSESGSMCPGFAWKASV